MMAMRSKKLELKCGSPVHFAVLIKVVSPDEYFMDITRLVGPRKDRYSDFICENVFTLVSDGWL